MSKLSFGYIMRIIGKDSERTSRVTRKIKVRAIFRKRSMILVGSFRQLIISLIVLSGLCILIEALTWESEVGPPVNSSPKLRVIRLVISVLRCVGERLSGINLVSSLSFWKQMW